MAAANYTAFVERMIGRYEGGYGWDPRDPGGPTKYGITCFDLAAYYGERMTSMSAWAPRVKAMPLSVADEIYRKKYATATKFDSLNSGPDCALFDFGVNSGPSRAVKEAQAIAGTAPDGILGPITLAAINGMDAAEFVNALCDRRLAFLRGLRTWPTFGRGWSARVKDLRMYCLRLTKSALVAEHTPEPKELRIAHAFVKGVDGDAAGGHAAA